MNEQALKDRLKHIARNKKKSFQEVWKLLLLERLLVRLAHSKYQNKLIFKGGLLLSYYLVIVRETTDIDFLARQLQAEKPQLEKMLFEICDGACRTISNLAAADHFLFLAISSSNREALSLKFG